MSDDYNPSSRPLVVKLNGQGPYIVTEFTSRESLSLGCKTSMSMVSSEELSAKILGKPMTCSYQQGENKRNFNALITSLELVEYSPERGLYFYRIGASDALSILAFRHNRQIFQNVSTKKVIETLLSDAGIKSYVSFSVSGEGVQHEYCTQMDETDLAFLQRILSAEGWHYHADHTGSSHKVVIADTNQAFNKADNSPLAYKNRDGSGDNALNNWKQKNKVTTAKVSLSDYNRKIPELVESGEQTSSLAEPVSNLSSYFYACGESEKSTIRSLSKTVMAAQDSEKLTSSASSSLAELSAGLTFTLTEHPISSCNTEYLITEITHQIRAAESGRDVQYRNQFQCIASATPFRPKFIPKPKVANIHSAVVTGPSGEEIYNDDQGRIKVQFHWDTQGKSDENTSCWLPVSQGFASKGFGMQFTPRIGDEVLVSYIDGNPDNPVVTGSLYGSTNKPPFSSSSQSGIRTRTTPDGSSQTCNEIRFDDQKDKEALYIHAQKDMQIAVENDSTTTITGAQSLAVEKTITVTSKEAHSISTEKTLSLESKEAMSAKSEKTLDLISKDNLSAKSDKNIALDAGSNADLTATSKITVDGQQIAISGKTKIVLSVGASKIELSASGIKIEAPQISIAGQAKAEMKAAMVTVEGQGKTDVKGALVSVNGSAMTQIKAGAMVQLQGAITKVN